MVKKKLCAFFVTSVMLLCGGDVSGLSYDLDFISNDDNKYMSSTFYYSIREGLFYLNRVVSNSNSYSSISSYIEKVMDVDLPVYEESIFNEGIPLMIDNYNNYISAYESGNSSNCYMAVKSIMDDSIKFSSVVDLFSFKISGVSVNTFSFDYDTLYINNFVLKSLYPAKNGLFGIVNNMINLYSYNISYDYSNYVYWSFYFKNFGLVFDKGFFWLDYDRGCYYLSYYGDLVNIKESILSNMEISKYSYVKKYDSFLVRDTGNTYYYINDYSLFKVYAIDCFLSGSVDCSYVYDLLHDNSYVK